YDFQPASDEERFSGLMQIAPVHRFGNTSDVDWEPRPIDVEGTKKTIALDFRNRVAAAFASALAPPSEDRLALAGRAGMLASRPGADLPEFLLDCGSHCMSADGAAIRPALSQGDASSDLAGTGASANPDEVEVLRNSLSAIMVEHHEQAKKLASAAADQAIKAQEIAALTAQNLELSRELAARADAAARCAAAEAQCEALRSNCRDLEERLAAIQTSASWRATRRLRAVFGRHPRLHRLVKTIRLVLARP